MKLSLFMTLATLVVAPASARPMKGRQLKGPEKPTTYSSQDQVPSKGQTSKSRGRDTPSPSPYKSSKSRNQRPGSSSCTYSPDYSCYVNGWASCCGTPKGCPPNPPCDVGPSPKTTPSPTPYKTSKSTSRSSRHHYHPSNEDACVPDDRPRPTRDGQRYRFNLVGANGRCTDEDGQYYEFGQIDDIEDFGQCADACVEDVDSEILKSFRGIDFDCRSNTCNCLYDEGTLDRRNSADFDRTSRYGQGYGSITGSRGSRGMYCGKLVGADAMGANEFLNADVTELWDSTADEDEDNEEFIDEDDSKINWDDVKNKTKDIARKTADGTKEAAERTADGAKKAADKTADWGKKTFNPDSPATTKSSMFTFGSIGLASVLYYTVA